MEGGTESFQLHTLHDYINNYCQDIITVREITFP